MREIGYTDPAAPFCAGTLRITELLTAQAREIAQGVDADQNAQREQGAGDQGIMFGYATTETPELMPLPILLAHRLAQGLAEDRKSGRVPWLRPDGKTQVSVQYDGNEPKAVHTILVATQHTPSVDQAAIHAYVVRTNWLRGDWGPGGTTGSPSW